LVFVKPPKQVAVFVLKFMETNYITKKEWVEIFPEARDYLEISLIENTEKLEKLSKEYSEQLDRINKIKDINTRQFMEIFADVFTGEDIKECESKIKTINQYLQSDQPEIPGRITDNDIERAKNYPFEDLVGTKAKFIKCPFHDDHSPSFYIKKNFGYCFSCGKHCDTIQWCIEVEGLSFIQAVKRLK
jgi:hypothetical protein